MEKGTKRKRNEDYPRITYNVGPRTFDRLLKEESLDEMKNVVRKKLGYSQDIPLQLAQLRDGRTVDLEDDDDFEAFFSAAHSLPVIVVQVTAPTGVQSEPPRVSHEPSEEATVEQPKKRRKKRRTEDTPHVEEVDPNTTAKKRKTLSDGVEVEKDAPEQYPQPLKKKRKANPEQAQVNGVSTEHANSVPPSEPPGQSSVPTRNADHPLAAAKPSRAETNHTTQDASNVIRDAQQTSEKPKKKRSKKKSTVTEQPEDIPVAATEKRMEDSGEAGNPADDEGVGSKSSENAKVDSAPARKTNAKKASKNPKVVPEKVTREPIESNATVTNANDTSESSERDSPEDHRDDSSKEGKQAKAKESQTTQLHSEKVPFVTEEERAAVELAISAVMARNQSAPLKSKSKVAETKGKELNPKQLSEQKSSVSAARKSATPSSVQCPICLRTPIHARSRCPYVRQSGGKALRDRLAVLENEDTDDESGYRSNLIKEIKRLISKKDEKEKASGKTKVAPKARSMAVPPEVAKVTPNIIPGSIVPRTMNDLDSRKTSNNPPKILSRRVSSFQEDRDKPVTPSSSIPLTQNPGRRELSPADDSASATPNPIDASQVPVPIVPIEDQPPLNPRSISAAVSKSSRSQNSKDPSGITKSLQQGSSTSNSNDDQSSSAEEPSDPLAVAQAAPVSHISHLVPASLLDTELDAVIRGPSAHISAAELVFSESEQDEEDDLLEEEDEEEKEEPISRLKRPVARDSSDEPESDESSNERDARAPSKPPVVVSARALATESPGDSDEDDENPIERSFHDVNEMASSMEIDRAGDRAFSEALAEDTAVYKLAQESDSNPKSSSTSDESDNEVQPLKTPPPKPASIPITPAKTSLRPRKDSIEQFETPNARPLSPIEGNFEKQQSQSTPRIVDKMKDRSGKTPQVSPRRPTSSLDKAMKLLDSVAQTKRSEASAQKGPAARIRSSARLAASSGANAVAPAAAAPKPVGKTPRSQKPPSIRTATQATKPKTTGRRTRQNTQESESEHSDAVHDEEAAKQATQISLDTWAILEEESMGADNDTNVMVDELESTDGHEVLPTQHKGRPSSPQKSLFIESETQPSFPYSQWTGNTEPFVDDSDEEEEVERAVKQPRPSTQRGTQMFRRLTDIASQEVPFHSNISAVQPTMANKAKASEKDLFGQTADSDTSDSETDSESDDNKKRSHIPKSRRAGTVTSKP